MQNLLIIRHGEAGHLVQGLTGGWTDTPLTGLGRKQAELTGARLAELLEGRKFGFYASDLIRTKETAEIIAGSLGVSPVFMPHLRELNNGEAAGLTLEAAEKILNPLTHPIVDWRPYNGAENWQEMSERVVFFLESVVEEETVLIVTHGGPANAAVIWWLELGIGEKPVAFEFDPCSITRLTINKWQERTITKLNDTSHLQELGQPIRLLPAPMKPSPRTNW